MKYGAGEKGGVYQIARASKVQEGQSLSFDTARILSLPSGARPLVCILFKISFHTGRVCREIRVLARMSGACFCRENTRADSAMTEGGFLLFYFHFYMYFKFCVSMGSHEPVACFRTGEVHFGGETCLKRNGGLKTPNGRMGNGESPVSFLPEEQR